MPRVALFVLDDGSRQGIPFTHDPSPLADIKGNGVRAPGTRCVQIDIVCDQKVTCTHSCGTRAFGQPPIGLSMIRLPVWILKLSLQALVLARTAVRQILPLFCKGCIFVEVNRDAQLISYALAQLTGVGLHLLHLHIRHRHQWTYIGGPHSWMGAAVPTHIDHL